MGSSETSARGTYYTDPSWYDGRSDEYGEVYIRSKRVKKALGLGVHHLVRFDLPSDSKRNWVVFEWMGSGLKSYACDSISTNNCIYLGKYYLKDVYRAALEASKGKSYSSSYNCNHWVENFAWKLDRTDITVHWNCSCVL